mgnify:FL=1
MNRLKEFAKALNKAAPKGEFLAFINKDEAEMLENAGGSGLLTKFGIPSYFVGAERDARAGRGDISPGTDRQGNQRDGGGNQNNNNQKLGLSPGESRARFGTPKYAGLSLKDATNRRNNEIAANNREKAAQAARQKKLTEEAAAKAKAFKEQQEKERKEYERKQNPFFKVIDFYQKVSPFTNIIKGISDLSSSAQKKALTFSLNKKIRDISNRSDFSPGAYGYKIQQIQKDLDAVERGEFGQREYTEKYGSGDATNPLDASFNPNALTDSERDNLSTLFASEAAVALSGGTPQNSVVNQYFKSINNANLGVSSAYMDTYNQAKDRMAKSLNLTPTNEQFGYNPNAFSNYSMSMTSDNPFFEELQNQGII